MLALLLALSGAARADLIPIEPQEVHSAEDVLGEQGCTRCHSLDGAHAAGPTLAGLWGRERAVIRDGQRVVEPFDDAALRSALATPGAEKPEGSAGNMPAYELDEAELSEIRSAMMQLAEVEVAPAAPPSGWTLGLAMLAFVGGHLLLSARPVRRRLIEAMELKGFLGLYGMLMMGAFMWMIVAWVQGPQVALWSPPRWTTHIPISVMPFVWVLWALGYSAKSPTSAGQDGLLDEGQELARGVLRVTRHPANLANGLWALVHLGANPELRNVLLFGGMLALSVLGSWHIDRRRAAEHPEGWARYAKETSFIPFLAILQGRNRLVLSEIRWKVALGGLVGFVVFLGLHKWIIGVSPLPG
ncbi:MAG: NnrU family protein [Alphaproteobacteria bacterium]|nr:NnrU family protein [Alphaproteobacteria bacterium]